MVVYTYSSQDHLVYTYSSSCIVFDGNKVLIDWLIEDPHAPKNYIILMLLKSLISITLYNFLVLKCCVSLNLPLSIILYSFTMYITFSYNIPRLYIMLQLHQVHFLYSALFLGGWGWEYSLQKTWPSWYINVMTP